MFEMFQMLKPLSVCVFPPCLWFWRAWGSIACDCWIFQSQLTVLSTCFHSWSSSFWNGHLYGNTKRGHKTGPQTPTVLGRCAVCTGGLNARTFPGRPFLSVSSAVLPCGDLAETDRSFLPAGLGAGTVKWDGREQTAVPSREDPSGVFVQKSSLTSI